MSSSTSKVRPKLTQEEERLLRIRELLSRYRPRFMRIDAWRFKRVSEGWRKPRGLDNKIRLEIKGYPAKVKIGYRGPKEVRGLHPSGFEEVIVHNPDELIGLDPRRHAVRIAASVSRKKRAEIVKRAMELGLKVLNPCRVGEVG
ncbi:MAG: 50S ribosomal protein L32e [Thermoprotei archaeon]|nr:MAG: 50S ribosomal protein L32e [Thermoprotei archaeon]RLF24454.1 MAG: 50S ribosomal protein L32e [Thermoprotei archaeon]